MKWHGVMVWGLDPYTHAATDKKKINIIYCPTRQDSFNSFVIFFDEDCNRDDSTDFRKSGSKARFGVIREIDFRWFWVRRVRFFALREKLFTKISAPEDQVVYCGMSPDVGEPRSRDIFPVKVVLLSI